MICETLFQYKHELKNEPIALATKPIRFKNNYVIFSRPLIVKKTTVGSKQIMCALLILDRGSNLRDCIAVFKTEEPKKRVHCVYVVSRIFQKNGLKWFWNTILEQNHVKSRYFWLSRLSILPADK